MNVKISGVMFVMLASASFTAAAAGKIDPNSAVKAEALVSVKDTSSVGISITPVLGLTVDAVKKGGDTDLAKYTITGRNAAVRLLNPGPVDKYCSYVVGKTNPTNKIEVCMKTSSNGFNADGVRYYAQAPGDYFIRGGADNKSGKSGVVVGADVYTFSLEVAKYTL
ncbi:hypothetical protein [Aeromonas jandaei]|uniref:hypothetical protein n=1 Tax=Aeromonas jandaei TaxID=650 RepID=UPI003B9E57C6